MFSLFGFRGFTQREKERRTSTRTHSPVAESLLRMLKSKNPALNQYRPPPSSKRKQNREKNKTQNKHKTYQTKKVSPKHT